MKNERIGGEQIVSISFKLMWVVIALLALGLTAMVTFWGIPAPKAVMKKEYTLEQLKQKQATPIDPSKKS
jgi:hypothetical protein